MGDVIMEYKIEQQHLEELHSKKVKHDPHKFDLKYLSHSGRHIVDVTEESC